jgi:chemotaxis receptor (MCP) glutamine deamidase CheD
VVPSATETLVALGLRPGGCTRFCDLAGVTTVGGTKNVDVACRGLAEEGIPIVAEDVGGYAGRKLVFLTDEGHVWVKKL